MYNYDNCSKNFLIALTHIYVSNWIRLSRVRLDRVNRFWLMRIGIDSWNVEKVLSSWSAPYLSVLLDYTTSFIIRLVNGSHKMHPFSAIKHQGMDVWCSLLIFMKSVHNDANAITTHCFKMCWPEPIKGSRNELLGRADLTDAFCF